MTLQIDLEARSSVFFRTEQVVIYNDDLLTTETVENGSIDLIVTSPPYNVGIVYDSHDDETPYSDYLEFTRRWLAKCYQLVKDDGRFCLNIPLDKNKGGQQSVCADITTIAKQVGWRYHSTVIWNEQNISRRTAWGSWLSASAPYVIAPVEVIVILYKKQWRKESGSRVSDISKKEFQEWTNGVWGFSGESKRKIGHPAPFPVELPRRCIKLFSYVGDKVLDPFLGSGSTLVACSLTERKGIGVEIDRGYCEIAKQRVIKEGKLYQPRLEYMGGKIMDEKSISELVMEYFRKHPNQDLRHGPVVDWVEAQYVRQTGKKPRDPWREIRKLHQEGQLIKVDKGVYRYDPSFVKERELFDFPPEVKEEIFRRDNYRCVVCNRGREDGVEICADHKIPKDKGGSNTVDNGQTLCTEHNLLKKNYSQTEAGKRFITKIYESALASGDERMIRFCKEVFDAYDKHGVNSHIPRPNGKKRLYHA